MRYIRSWPRDVSELGGRARSNDDIERVYVSRFDIWSDPENSLPMEAFTHLDWDIIPSREDYTLWEDWVSRWPNNVHVAPYTLYPCSTQLPRKVIAHRNRTPDGNYEWVDIIRHGVCDAPSFGMIYFPEGLLAEYPAHWPLTDADFARFMYETHRTAMIAWDVRPIHLHHGGPGDSGAKPIQNYAPLLETPRSAIHKQSRSG